MAMHIFLKIDGVSGESNDTAHVTRGIFTIPITGTAVAATAPGLALFERNNNR